MDRALDDTLAGGLTCVVEAEAVHPVLGVVPLRITTGTLTIDETQVPRYQLHGAVAITPEAIAALDETREVRVRINAGYVYPGRVRDVHPLCNLMLTAATLNRPEGRIDLDATSDETKLAYAPWTLPSIPAGRTVDDALFDIIAATAGVGSAQLLVDPDLASRVAFAEAPRLSYGTNYQQLAVDIADRVGARFFHANGFYQLTDNEWDSTPVAAITAGERGLLRSYQAKRDRLGWGNAQLIEYKWRDDAANVDRVVVGRAELTTGPLAVPAVGRKVLPILTRAIPTTQAEANAAARSILERRMMRGRVDAVEAARALWWVAPGRTVTIATPDEPAAHRVVSAVTFDLPAATMQITTRKPVEE